MEKSYVLEDTGKHATRYGALDCWRRLQQLRDHGGLVGQQGRGPEFVGISQANQTTWETFLFAVGEWDNWREPFFRKGGRLLERLDRFYVSDWAIDRGGQVGVVPMRTMLQ